MLLMMERLVILNSLYFIWLFMIVQSQPWVNSVGTVGPTDPNLWVGDELKLQCTITDPNVTQDFESLYFTKNDLKIHEKYYHRISLKGIELRLPGIKIQDEGNFVCKLGEKSYVGSQRIMVFQKPQPVTSIHCMVFNWESMVCTWDLGVNFHHPPYIQVTLVWVIEGAYARQNDCAKLTNSSCTWTENEFRPNHIYRMLVIVNNTKMNYSNKSDKFTINSQTIVKPAAVENLKAHPINSSCLFIDWTHNKVMRDKTCLIELKSKWELREEMMSTRRNHHQNITVCDLYPNLLYTVSVSCVPKSGGFYSNKSETNIQMSEYVPSSAPEVSVGSYTEVNYPNKDGFRNVTIYWKPVPEKNENGVIVEYVVTANGQIWNIHDVSSNKATIQLLWEQTYEITIQAKTSKGLSPRSLPVYVKPKSSKPKPPQYFYAIKEGNSVGLYWKPNGVIDDSVTNYTIFYCQAWRSTQTCRGRDVSVDGDINWIYLSRYHTNYSMELSGPLDDYLFGISTDTPTFSSGMVWSDCTYSNDHIPRSPPKNFQFADIKGDLSLVVQWERYSCEESPPILSYQLSYCPVTKESDYPMCTVSMETIVIASFETTYTLDGLEAGKMYAVSLQAETSRGMGQQSTWIYETPIKLVTKLSNGEISGIIIAGVCVLSLALLGLIVCGRRVKKSFTGFPEESIIMPPPLPDARTFDSHLNGSGHYAVCSPSDSPTSRTSLLSNANSTLGSNNSSDITGLTDDSCKVSILPQNLTNGYIPNGSSHFVNNRDSPVDEKKVKRTNALPDGYLRFGSHGTSPGKLSPPVSKDSLEMFTVNDGKLRTTEHLSLPLNSKHIQPNITSNNYLDRKDRLTESPDSSGFHSTGPKSSGGSSSQIGSYTKFDEGYLFNCVGSAISLASSGGVLRHTPPPEVPCNDYCDYSDTGEYEEPIKRPLSTSTPIGNFPEPHSLFKRQNDQTNAGFGYLPHTVTLDTRSLPSILECVGPMDKNEADSQNELLNGSYICNVMDSSQLIKQNNNSNNNNVDPGYIQNPELDHITAISVPENEDTEVDPTSSSNLAQIGYISVESLTSNPSIVTADDSPIGYVHTNGSLMIRESDLNSQGDETPHNNESHKSCNETPQNKESHKSCNETPQNNESHKSCNETPQNNESHKSCNETPQNNESHKSCNGTPHNNESHKSCNETPQNIESHKSCNETPQNNESHKSCNETPQNNESHKSCNGEIKVPESLEELDNNINVSQVINGYVSLPNADINNISKLSCSSVVRPISNYMKDLPVQYFEEPKALDNMPTTEL